MPAASAAWTARSTRAQLYAGSAGLRGSAGFVGAAARQESVMRTTWTCRPARIGNVVPGSPSVLASSSRPTSIPGDALAAGTQSAAAATTTARTPPNRLDTGRLTPPALDPAPQPVLEVDLGLPAQHLACPRDVGPPHLRVVP